MVKNFGKVHIGKITCMVTTSNSKYLYSGDNCCFLKKICVETQILEYDFGNISNEVVPVVIFVLKYVKYNKKRKLIVCWFQKMTNFWL